MDEHVANPNVNVIEQNHSLSEIYNRDIRWIKACDMVVAEVSTASLGVGYECCYAEQLCIPVIVLCDKNVNISVINNININENQKQEYYSMVIYFVKPGDTLWNIAKKFKSTVEDISKINEIDNENKINIGDELFIPRYVGNN